MKIYAKINSQEQIVNEATRPSCPDDYIEMECERPIGAHWVASKDGKWVDLAKEELHAKDYSKQQESSPA